MPAGAHVFHSSGISDASLSGAGEASESAYTVAHTISGRRTIHLNRHLTRLFDSVSRLGYSTPWSEAQIRCYLCACIEHLQLEQSRFRITLPQDGSLVLSIEPYAGLPAQLRRDGVVCATALHAARSEAETKTTQWIENRKKVMREHAYETLLCGPDNAILEGTSSNFFAVCSSVPTEGSDDGRESAVVYTAGEGVLKGITRSVVLELCSEFARVEYTPVTRDALGHVQEAFITSSTRGIVPVRTIDNYHFGRPGSVTVALMKKYDAWVEAHAEPICETDSNSDSS